MKRSFFRQTVSIYLTEFASRGVGFFTTVLIAKYISDSALGQISYASSAVFMLAVFTDLGYAAVAVKNFAKAGGADKKALNPAFTLKFFSSLAVFAAVCLYLGFYGRGQDGAVNALFFLFALNLLVSSLSFPYQFSLRGLRRFQYENALKLGTALAGFLLLAVFINLRPDVALIGGGIPLGMSLVTAAAYYLLNSRGKFVEPAFTFKPAALAAFFRECLPFSLAVVITLFHNKLDIVILKGFTDFRVVGLYALAYKCLEAVNIFPGVIYNITFPYLAARFTEGGQALAGTLDLMTRYLAAAAAASAVLVFFLGERLVVMAMGPAYAESGRLLGLLAPALVPSFLYSVTSGAILAGPKPFANTYIQAGSSLAYFLLLFLLVPLKGVYGLALSFVLVEWAALAVKMFYIRTSLCPVAYTGMAFRIFIAAASASVPFWFSRGFVSALVFLCVYTAIMFLSGFIDRKGCRDFYAIAGAFGG